MQAYRSAQRLRSATERRSGPSQAAWTIGSAGWRGGGPWTGWNAAGIGAMRSRMRSAAGDRRSRLELERCWQAWARDQERRRIDACVETCPLRLQVRMGEGGPQARRAERRVGAAGVSCCRDKIKKSC